MTLWFYTTSKYRHYAIPKGEAMPSDSELNQKAPRCLGSQDLYRFNRIAKKQYSSMYHNYILVIYDKRIPSQP